MDMGVREWLVVVAVILIIGILADGFRRMKAAKRRQHEFGFSLDKTPADFNDELPNGGARVISSFQQTDHVDAEQRGQGFEGDHSFGSGLDQDFDHDAEHNDPLFMPPPREASTRAAVSGKPSEPESSDDLIATDDFDTHETFGSALDDTIDYSINESMDDSPRTQQARYSSPEGVEEFSLADSYVEDRPPVPVTEEPYVPAQTSLNLDEPVPVLMEVDGQPPIPPTNKARSSHKTIPDKASRKPQTTTKPREKSLFSQPVESSSRVGSRNNVTDEKARKHPPAEVIVINVFSRDPQGFDGNLLLQQLLANGLKFGEMSIFHRHKEFNGHGKVQFSIANGVEPGNFDLDNLADLRTPLITMFMGMPGPAEPLKAFEMMAAAAYNISTELGGNLKDESHSAMTQQTLEHCKQRIMDFERRQLALDREFNNPRT